MCCVYDKKDTEVNLIRPGVMERGRDGERTNEWGLKLAAEGLNRMEG